MLSWKLLHQMLDYDRRTGLFRWKIRPTNSVRVGAIAGTETCNGYISISLKGRTYLAHRLAWFYVKGVWPEGDVDHKDQNKKHNALLNLREATRSQNSVNATKKRGKSGFRGVYYVPGSRKWMARVRKNYKHIYLGLHATPEEAAATVRAKEVELHGEFVPQ